MDKWISIAAVTLATTVAACTASQDSFKIRPVLSLDGKPLKDRGAAEYEKGKQLLSEGRFAPAAQAFQAALLSEGSSVKVLNALAVSYGKLGRYDLSDRYYQRALALNPNNPQTVNNLAVSLAQRGAPDLAAKVLADAHAQRPSDKTISDNLKLAQDAATREATAATVAPLPTPSAPQVPRIEQTSPSSQQLVTIGAHSGTTPHQQAMALPMVANTADATPVKPDETRSSIVGASASEPAAVSGPLAVAKKAATIPLPRPDMTPPSPLTQQVMTISAAQSDAALQPAVTPRVVRSTADEASAKMDEGQERTGSAPALRPAIISEALAPPPTHEQVDTVNAQQMASVSQLQAATTSSSEHRLITVPPQLASKAAAAQGTPPASGAPAMELARSRLGSRIAESENIQPIGVMARNSRTPKLALERLGMRVEVANGAGRRYMAARMRTFLDGHGYDVAHVINAPSFDYSQTVIVYRDQYQRQALDLAKSLATKVELVHVADLPVDVRLILGHDLVPFDRMLEKGG